MIVVLGAGAIAKFSGNPLEAMTTITTRIVSQLTGDGDFNGPETLNIIGLSTVSNNFVFKCDSIVYCSQIQRAV